MFKCQKCGEEAPINDITGKLYNRCRKCGSKAIPIPIHPSKYRCEDCGVLIGNGENGLPRSKCKCGSRKQYKVIVPLSELKPVLKPSPLITPPVRPVEFIDITVAPVEPVVIMEPVEPVVAKPKIARPLIKPKQSYTDDIEVVEYSLKDFEEPKIKHGSVEFEKIYDALRHINMVITLSDGDVTYTYFNQLKNRSVGVVEIDSKKLKKFKDTISKEFSENIDFKEILLRDIVRNKVYYIKDETIKTDGWIIMTMGRSLSLDSQI